MKAQLLTILMMGSLCCFGKGNESVTAVSQQLKPLNLKPYGQYGGSGGGSNVHFSINVEIGYAGTTANSKFSGGSLYASLGLGTAIELPSRSESRTGILSVAANFEAYDLKTKYTDNNGSSQTNSHRLTGLMIPISYSSFMFGRNGEEGRGFYWEVGTNVNYVGKVTLGSKPETALFNRIQVEPKVGFGLHTPFVLRWTSNGGDIGQGRVQIGLWGSYVANNMLTGTSEMHNFKIGIKYQYIFM